MADRVPRENDDIFLRVETAKQGAIKGESRDDKHKDEIDVHGWSWGMEAKSALGGAGATAKASINQLNVVKAADSASTALMSAMRNNDLIKKAVLTVRKAGKIQHEYFRITIENGRITSLDIRTADAGGLTESLGLSFQKIKVEYVPQGEDGQPRGGMVFETEIATAS